ncbi:hypothetical protein [Snodgrassella communis]|uniref:hypothetical protein n=1 Tax=Snodgrassella communis TaxID=2946699 RepID=UPI001EF3F2B7|nr:hypothetical protein [Snodgrassella communis]WMY91995.1 hypothetical protein PYG29_01015 [Snodgrassella communis]
MIGYFALRKQFTVVSDKLRVTTLIFSSAIVFILTFTLAAIIAVINLYLVQLVKRLYEPFTQSEAIVFGITDVILFFLVLCVMGWVVVRKTAKAFFNK